MVPHSTDERHAGVTAARTPDRPAVISARDGSVVTFAQFEALSNRAAHLLRAASLVRGDRCAIWMENTLLYLPLVWGALRAGLRLIPVATHLTAEEAQYILADGGAGALFTCAKKAEAAARLSAPTLPDDKRFVLGRPSPGFVTLEDALAGMPDTPIVDQSEGVEMLYSSGTTGRPKGIDKPMPTGPFGVPSAGTSAWVQRYGIDEETVYFHPAPLYHAAPLLCSMRTHRFGGTIVLADRFDAAGALDVIARYRVTHSQWVPTHFVRMLRLPQEVRDRADVSSLRIAIHAAAPCPIEVKRRMIAWWGPIVHEYYGGSEGNGYVTLDAVEWLAKPGSVGRATIGTLRVCDEAGEEVPAGTEGTVYFEGGPRFAYHNDPDATAAAYNERGWSTLGDVGYVDADGYLFLTDRRTFMIVSGGVNIYPAEIESLVIGHPKVEDVAVFGVPDEEFGEAVKAVVQPLPAHRGDPSLADEIIAWCRERLSHVKCPRTVDLVDALPREENGKLYKRKLRDAYWPAAGDTARPASRILA